MTHPGKLVIIITCSVFLWGCAAQKTAQKTQVKKKSQRDTVAILNQHPQRIDQSEEHDHRRNDTVSGEHIPSEEWTEVTEKTMGYKIQLTSTTSLDEATKRRDEFKNLLDGETIELKFDAPYYKLRVGNFTQKKLAEEYRDTLQTKGFTEAWVVRDQITITVRKKKGE